MKKALALSLLLFALPLLSQPSNTSIVQVSTAPSGACGAGLPLQFVISTGALYSCQGGTWGVTSSASPLTLAAGTTATTTFFAGDGTTAVATNAFVQNALRLTMSRVGLTVTGGTYSFDSQGSGATVVVGSSGGAVTSIITWAGGTGYAVGDLITVGQSTSNQDAYIRITAVTSGAPTAGTIIYGGTGYTSFGGFSATPAISSLPFTFVLTGTLTSNAQFIMTNGTYLTQSNQWVFANNTTGNFSTNVCVAGATDACAGGGATVTLNQGVANSTAVLIETDGQLNVFLGGIGIAPVHGVLTLTAGTSDTLTLQGVLPASICSFSPSNALAAAATVIAYVSAVAANSVTITHVVTTASGGTENVTCSTY